jgi:hypothetical protein
MRTHVLACLATLGLAAPLAAQEPHFGFAFNLGFPTGDFREKTFPPPSATTSSYKDGFDAGFGGQFTISFPIERNFAVRMNFTGQSTSGSSSGASFDRQNLQHNLFSLGGEFQLFMNGSALRHRGTYFYFGPSADFERWDYSNDSRHDYWNDYTTYDRKSRMGANVGIGNSFGSHVGRFTMEVGFHKTISGNDTAKGDPPSADFVKLSFGWVF